jgi:putative restriction endonuclease
MSQPGAEQRFVVASTDPDWFRFLRSRPDLPEINFWRPSGSVSSEVPGTPWFFRIRKTELIAGCGFFATSYRLPIGVAWETFTAANGFETYPEFAAKMAQLQGTALQRVGEIGCTVLTQPIYFSSPVPYKRMYGPLGSQSTADAEGSALWAELVTQIQLAMLPVPGSNPLIDSPHAGFGAPTLVTPRLGQAAFRINVTKAYQRQCAITNEKTLPALQAAHIRPFAASPSHATSNGILFRSDIHHLFDQGYVSVQPDLVFRVSKAIKDEFSNGRDYYAFDGLSLREPERPDQRPDRAALDWHYSTLFRG